MKLIQQHKTSQKLIMTSKLQMAIKLLQLSRFELIEKISNEIESNPLLEEFQSELEIDNQFNYESNLEFYSENTYSSPENYREFNISSDKSLNDHLLWQLLLTPLNEEEKKIGIFIIGNLSNNGYLKLSLLEIIKQTKKDMTIIEKVIKTVQSLDPSGICARNLKEYLLIQAKHMNLESNLVVEIISNNLFDLKNKNYQAISKALRANIEEIYDAANIISFFDPKPELRFNTDITEYIIPDIHVYKIDGSFCITINDIGLPKLRINSHYERGIFKGKFDLSTRKYLRKKMDSAIRMIKSIEQRQITIFKVMKNILRLQKDFFHKGYDYLKPMGLKEVARDINMHESTISRATNSKYVSTHIGIFELKYFFSSPIRCLKGGFVASTSVKKKIKNMIRTEDVSHPYTDSKISELLKIENINIARRTVSKYRKKWELWHHILGNAIEYV